MTPTMKDVAARAGVSIKSVSRVVNGHPNISDQVRERVQQAIAELDFQPNLHARSLRTGRTGLIAVSLPDLSTPTLARFAQLLVAEAERQNLRVALEPSRGRKERVQQTLDARGAAFDAVIHVGPLPAGAHLPSSQRQLPVIVLHSAAGAHPVEEASPVSPAEQESVDRIEPDEGAAALAVQRHLSTLGHRSVVIFGRERGVPDLYTEHLCEVFPTADVLRPDGPAGRAAGRELAASVLAGAEHLDAIVCADDELAIGALSLLVERGIPVPDRLALTGHGAIEDGLFTTPSLTTIDVGAEEMARLALERVQARLAGERGPGRRLVVPISLRRGESTLGVPAVLPRPALEDEAS